MANLTMGLAGQTAARSVVEISLSPCYHYQHSSINKAIDALFSEAEAAKQGQQKLATARLDTEKKFVHQGRTFTKALRKILAAEYGQ